LVSLTNAWTFARSSSVSMSLEDLRAQLEIKRTVWRLLECDVYSRGHSAILTVTYKAILSGIRER
jgi:hypothetical protein